MMRRARAIGVLLVVGFWARGLIASLPNTNIARRRSATQAYRSSATRARASMCRSAGTDPRLSNVTITASNVPPPEGDVRIAARRPEQLRRERAHLRGLRDEALDVGSSHLQTGVRVEVTQSSYTGNHVTLNTAAHCVSTQPVSGSSNYTNVLHSLQYRLCVQREHERARGLSDGDRSAELRRPVAVHPGTGPPAPGQLRQTPI